MGKKIIIAFVSMLVAIQFFRPQRNDSADNLHALDRSYYVPANIAILMNNSCADCHSNNTRYPWYANIQPAGWWVNHHVQSGKLHLNLSEFTGRSISRQYHGLSEMAESVESNFMPLASYTWLGMHPEAKLTDEQRDQFAAWARQQLDSLERVYPYDSIRSR